MTELGIRNEMLQARAERPPLDPPRTAAEECRAATSGDQGPGRHCARRSRRPARLLLGSLLVSAGLPAAADFRYEIINKSDLTLMEFYASPVGDSSWGEDLLTVHVLRSGAAETFAIIEVGRVCEYDLRFIMEDARETVDTADLCEVSSYMIENAR